MKKTKYTIRLEPGEGFLVASEEIFKSLVQLCEMASEGSELPDAKEGWANLGLWIKECSDETVVPYEYEDEDLRWK